jgi:hypothetical protein
LFPKGELKADVVKAPPVTGVGDVGKRGETVGIVKGEGEAVKLVGDPSVGTVKGDGEDGIERENGVVVNWGLKGVVGCGENGEFGVLNVFPNGDVVVVMKGEGLAVGCVGENVANPKLLFGCVADAIVGVNGTEEFNSWSNMLLLLGFEDCAFLVFFSPGLLDVNFGLGVGLGIPVAKGDVALVLMNGLVAVGSEECIEAFFPGLLPREVLLGGDCDVLVFFAFPFGEGSGVEPEFESVVDEVESPAE